MQAQPDSTSERWSGERVRPGRRGHLPLRVAPMLLVGMILLVLGILSTAVI